MSGTDTEMVIY